MTLRAHPLLAGAVVLAACGDPSVGLHDGGFSLFDAPLAQPPPIPRVDSAPSPVPWPLAVLRGTADAPRIIVEGTDNPLVSTVLPDGTWCVDVPLPTPDTFRFQIFAHGQDGQLSRMAANAEVIFDPSAPPIPGLTTCQGADPAGCSGSAEICDNGRDDDCNGRVDSRDPACATCTDDLLEPNDDPDAPRVEPGRYEGLRLCPANTDYYSVYARTGETISARIFFSHSAGDLDMALLGTDGATVLQRSTSTTDDEGVTQVAASTGEYPVRVYGVGDVTNDSILDVRVTP